MASYPPEALGRVIKEHRRRNRLTQEDLGIRAGYALKGAAVSISRVERGENRPSVDKLGGIASALKVTVDQLELVFELVEHGELLRRCGGRVLRLDVHRVVGQIRA